MNQSSQAKTVALGLLGAAVGGCLGYFVFFWLTRQNLYALIIPALLLGLGAGLAARRRSTPLAWICAVAGLLLGLFTEWRFAPFGADESFTYFMTHIHQLKPMTWLMLVIGAVVSYRLALGTDQKSNAG